MSRCFSGYSSQPCSLRSASSRHRRPPSTITDVTVSFGAVGCIQNSSCVATYTAASVGWNFSGGGVSLLPGQDLVLAQNFQGAPNKTTSYTFDTSDVQGPQNFAQISITVDGVTTLFTDANQVLNLKGLDVISVIDNEAQDFGLAMDGPGYAVFLGYADNVHAGACGGWASEPRPQRVGITVFHPGFSVRRTVKARLVYCPTASFRDFPTIAS